MIKAYCDRCEKEIPRNSDSEYFVELKVKNTCWVGNRDATYFTNDYSSSNTTRKFFLCGECLNELDDIVHDFMCPKQKDGEQNEKRDQ